MAEDFNKLIAELPRWNNGEGIDAESWIGCVGDAALEHFANIGHLMAPLMETATVTGELLGTPNDEIRGNLTGDRPKLYEPWMVMDEGAGAE